MTLLETSLSEKDSPGVYVIRCLANDATYCGSSLLMQRRLQLHVSLLRSGRSGSKLLQHDWNHFGEDQFEFLGCHQPAADLLRLEESLTLASDSLDDHGGYGQMLGKRVWSLSSRVRNTERKLINRRKWSPLPGYSSHLRISSEYVRSFCQGSTPFGQSEPLLTKAMERAEKLLMRQELLLEYKRVDIGKVSANK